MEDSSNHHEILNGKTSLNKMDGIDHPLQDVDLESSQNISQSPGIVTKKIQKNWVKFDDEVDGEVMRRANNSGNNNNNNTNTAHDIVETSRSLAEATSLASVPATESSLAVTTTTTILKKLSPPPPPRTKSNAATATNPTTLPTPTTVTNTGISGAPGEKTLNKHSAAVAPVQRSTIPSTIAETEVAPAVLATESTHVNLNSSSKNQHQQFWQQSQSPSKPQLHQQQQQQQSIPKSSSNILRGSDSPPQAASSPSPKGTASVAHGRQYSNNNGVSGNNAQTAVIHVESAPPMRTIELSTGRIREGFANGDVIVTLLPANTKWPWITPAIFRPELVPEELMAQGLTLTVEDYVHAMETLVNDYRFTVYNVCYKRILVCWILFAFAVLLTLLFSGLQGVALFSLGVAWLFLNAAAIFLCMWVKLRLARGLEKCLARVNKQLMRHKILLVLDDRGRISCHKVNLCFLYFDATQCVNFLNEFLEHTEQNGGEAIKAGWEAKLDLDLNDIVIQGSNPVRLSRKQAVAQEIFLSYLQRWGKDFLRRRLDWTVQEAGVHETPRHLQSSICPCQYEEDLLRNKIKTYLQRKQCCGINCLACWL